MIWDTMIQNIKTIFNSRDNKEWLNTLVEDFEKKVSEDKSLIFRIKQIKEKGFVAKVCGLFGFISFKHMPWQYACLESWKYVFNYLQDKTFLCKVHKFIKNPISIILDGELPQFKPLDLEKEKNYEGIIINKAKYGVFVEFGYSFNWQCGSIVGLLHKSDFEPDVFNYLECGEIVQAIYWGESIENMHVFGNNSENRLRVAGLLDHLVGKIVAVNIKKDINNQLTYLVEGKYPGALPVSKIYYPDRAKYIRKALSNLNDGEIIHCEVVRFTKNKRRPQLKWVIESEIERTFRRMLTDIVRISISNN